MIVLFTDFGADDLYVGQVKAVLNQTAPEVAVIDLLHSAPNFDIAASAHLLAALYPRFAPGSVLFAVVDPGVGGARDAVVMVADGYWFVGPDNGLLAVIAARTQASKFWRITWRPAPLSASCHGRDLFAPIAGWIAAGQFPADKLSESLALQVPATAADTLSIIYIDHCGNCVSGLRGANITHSAFVTLAGYAVPYAEIFSAVAPGQIFWYINSLGLVEVAVNRGRADTLLGVQVGAPLTY